MTTTVPVSRLLINTVIHDGSVFRDSLCWTSDADGAPAAWLQKRTNLLKGLPPGHYHESGRLVDAATGEVLESYSHQWTNLPTPVPYSEAESPDLSRWQVAILVLTAAPGVVAAIASLPFLAIACGSFKVTDKLKSAFEFLQTLNAPEPHDQNPCA